MTIDVHGIAGTDNSTTTPLGADETFTGEWENNAAPDVMVSCQADVAGTLYFDFSNDDGVNYSTFPTGGFSVAAGIHEFHVAVKGPRQFRLRLVNGSTEQTYLRIATYYGSFAKPNAPLNQSLGSDQDATVVRMLNPEIDESLGRLGGVQRRNKFGYVTGLNATIVIGTPSSWVDLWYQSGQRAVQLFSFTPYMASTAADTQDITVEYIDTNGYRQEVTVALTGTTPVSLGVTAVEVVRAYNSDNTTLTGQVDIATANNFTSGSADNQSEIVAVIPAADNQTQQLMDRVPVGKVFILETLRVEILRDNAGAASILAAFQIRVNGTTWRTISPLLVTSSAPTQVDLRGVVLTAETDFRVRIRDVGTNGTSVKGILSYHEVDV